MASENRDTEKMIEKADSNKREHDKAQAIFLRGILDTTQFQATGKDMAKVATQIATAKGWLQRFIDNG